MDVNSILDLARGNTHTTDTQITNTQAIKWFNIVYSDINSTLAAKVGEDYNFEIWKQDTIVDQDEYLLPSLTSSNAGLKKVKKVNVKYSSDDDYAVPATEVSLNSLPVINQNWEYHVANRSSATPIFFIADQSLFIAPAPSAVVTNGLEIMGVKKIVDLSVGDVETDIKLPVDYHYIIAIGIEEYIYRFISKKDAAENSRQVYEVKLENKMVELLNDRVYSPYVAKLPDDTPLQ